MCLYFPFHRRALIRCCCGDDDDEDDESYRHVDDDDLEDDGENTILAKHCRLILLLLLLLILKQDGKDSTETRVGRIHDSNTTKRVKSRNIQYDVCMARFFIGINRLCSLLNDVPMPTRDCYYNLSFFFSEKIPEG
jgi:hypothetical protein